MKTLRLATALFVSLASLISVRIEAAEQTPYLGTPFQLPGDIPAEYFDNGGEGVAYHDSDPGNQGRDSRASDVDVDLVQTGIRSEIRYVGWTQVGEWLEYTVDVQASASYTIRMRVASAGRGGTLHIEFDGVDKTGPMTVPDSGGWTSFTVIAAHGVQLDAGVHVLRVALDSVGPSGDVGNIDGISVTPSAIPIPGSFVATDFSAGGEGIAYHDTDLGNNGGFYRQTDVDIDPGNYVGWTQAGEWLNYDINVQASGNYALEVTVMSEGPGGTFHLEFNGVDKTGPISIPDTGGWRVPQRLSLGSAYLDAGLNTMRIVMDSNGASGGVGNFSWINIDPTQQRAAGFNYIPGIVEAERFDYGGEGVAYHDTDFGSNSFYPSSHSNVDVDYDQNNGGFYVGWTRAGEWLEYTMTVRTAGYYAVDVLVASEGDGGTFHLEFNGEDKTGPISVPDTLGWQRWQIVRAPRVYLDVGTQVMRLALDTNGASGSVANIDWLRFTEIGTIPGTIEAEAFNDGGEGVAYHDTDVGNNGGFYRATDVDIDYDSRPEHRRYYVGWTQAGEWLAYPAQVQSAGYYVAEAYVASQGPGGIFHIELNGVDVTGPLTVPDTGGWRNWQGISKYNIYLTPTSNATLRIVFDSIGSSGSVANVDFIRFTRQKNQTP